LLDTAPDTMVLLYHGIWLKCEIAEDRSGPLSAGRQPPEL